VKVRISLEAILVDHGGVGQQSLQIGGAGLAAGDLHQMGIAIARGQLDHAQPVAPRVEAHRLGVDGHNWAKVQPVGQVILVEVDRHVRAYVAGVAVQIGALTAMLNLPAWQAGRRMPSRRGNGLKRGRHDPASCPPVVGG
jgi:hypothetical protein